MSIEDRHQQAVEYALQILEKEPYNAYIDKIYLFGSYARKQQKYSSDVDLLIQCSEKISPEIVREMRIAVMPDCIDLPEVDLKFVINSNWKKQTDQFSRNLVKEGVLIWEKK